MRIEAVFHSDVGIRKKTNEDSMLMKEADTDYGRVFLAAVCDGMGGLANGEVASATVVRRLSEWFDSEFPLLLYGKNLRPGGLEFVRLVRESLAKLMISTNNDIFWYGKRKRAPLGSTAVVLLMAAGSYYILNVGDSRCYKVSGRLERLTKDQSLVQRKIDRGLIREEDAEKDPERNVLLQCIGATSEVCPDFYMGSYETDDVFVLCSDGFRHELKAEELFYYFSSDYVADERKLKRSCVDLTELVKKRKEQDNISVIAVRVKEERYV